MTNSNDVPQIDINSELVIEKEELGENESVAKNKPGFILGTVVLGTVIVLALGIGYLANKPQVSSIKNQELPTPVEAKPEKISLTFEVLNGSGVKGAAAAAASRLKASGMKVVATGNADKSDYQGNHLYVVAQLTDQAKDIVAKLDKLGMAAILEAKSLTDSTVSARLIIGK